jgi:hypothetical protein
MMTNMQTNRPLPDEVVVRLSYDEAFVLSDFLDRWSQAGFDQPHQLCSNRTPIIGPPPSTVTAP